LISTSVVFWPMPRSEMPAAPGAKLLEKLSLKLLPEFAGQVAEHFGDRRLARSARSPDG
jgi:hypothetical protein